MKLIIRFWHDKKAKQYAITPFWQHFDKDCGYGPVLQRGQMDGFRAEFRDGDILDFCTTRFVDEFNFFHSRKGRLVNGKGKPPQIPRRERIKRPTK